MMIASLLVAGFAQVAEPPSAGPNRAEVIDRAVQSMKLAQGKLAEGKTGAATQDLQKQALAALDELLKTPPKPPMSNPSGQGGGGSSQNSPSSSSPQNSSDKQPTPQSGQSQASADDRRADQERERSQAADSEERAGQRRTGVAATLPRRRLEVDVWGHLPEKVRDQLLNGYGERIVPQYESLVRRFYESLADTAADPQSRP
jgi:hypothetical protein